MYVNLFKAKESSRQIWECLSQGLGKPPFEMSPSRMRAPHLPASPGAQEPTPISLWLKPISEHRWPPQPPREVRMSAVTQDAA